MRLRKQRYLAVIYMHREENNHFGPISQHHFQSSQERERGFRYIAFDDSKKKREKMFCFVSFLSSLIFFCTRNMVFKRNTELLNSKIKVQFGLKINIFFKWKWLWNGSEMALKQDLRAQLRRRKKIFQKKWYYYFFHF